MKIGGQTLMVRVHLGEADVHHGRPLCQALITLERVEVIAQREREGLRGRLD